MPRITGRIPVRYIKSDIFHLIRFANPQFNIPVEIDALIGAQLFFQLLCIGQIRLNEHGLTLQRTRLGSVLAGKTNVAKGELNHSSCHVTINALHFTVQRF